MCRIFLECNTSTFEGFEIESEAVVNTIYWPVFSACGSIQYQWLTPDIYLCIYTVFFVCQFFWTNKEIKQNNNVLQAWLILPGVTLVPRWHVSVTHCWFATLTCLERTNRRNSRNAMNNSVKRTSMNNWHDFCLLIFCNKSFYAFSPCHFVPKTCLGHSFLVWGNDDQDELSWTGFIQEWMSYDILLRLPSLCAHVRWEVYHCPSKSFAQKTTSHKGSLYDLPGFLPCLFRYPKHECQSGTSFPCGVWQQ